MSSSKQPKICVVGSSNMDLISKIPRLPKMGETLVGSRFQMGCGGKGANQAVMAAKLGGNVTMVTKLGRDPMGDMTLKNYKDLGIDTQFVMFDDERFSGVAPILVDDEGRNMIVIVNGANDGLSPGDARAASKAIEEADVLICQLEIPVETTLEALLIARDAGVRTIFNPAPAQPLSPELIQVSDIVAPNETEAEIICEMEIADISQAEHAAAKIREMGAGVVIITLGENGVLVADSARARHVPVAYTRAVDTTGAGDAFVGSLAYFLGRDFPLDEAIRRSNAVAAISVQKVGTQVSFPTRNGVRDLLK